ncbi:unnamed protein product [Polarella glacialis]|uniref:Piezo non-specific cation channel R-Ras-binding domain-containing protein n=1 Tax=Polarella glacialis TaxID=89957 RepID=A0A813DRJ2_POLGL|nr:unnamed protein product [Polarella glacialis]
MAEPSSAAKCWSWARATAGSAGRRLLRDTRRIWFRYLYPNCFLMACLLRSGTVASAIYAVIALLLLGLPAAHPKWTEPGCWRRLHLVLFVVSGILFVATSVLYTLCKVGSLSPSARHVTEVLVLGSATSSDGAMGCGADPMFVFPESIAAAAGLVGWLLGPTAASEPEGQTVADSQKPNPLAESGRLKLVGLLLPVCAALDYNAFAAIYQLLAAILAASWAWCSPRRLSRATTNEEQTSEVASELPGCTRILLALLRAVLLLVAVAQLLLFVVASFPAVAGQLPAYVLRLLGARLSFWTVAQLQVCFLLMELLLWPGRENNPDGPVGSPGQEQGVPHQTSEELLRMEQAPSPVLLRRSPHSQRSVDSKVPSEPVHSLPQLSSSSRNAPPAKSAFLNWLVSAVEMASGHAFVPFISLWVLACAWPSLATLPLLLGAIGLMHLPLSGVPSFFLHSGLLYELLFSLALYGYNVFCFVAGEQFSRVPLVFTWMEQLGLQCYLREGPGSPGFRRFIWSLGQIFAVLLMAAAARHRTITAPTATRARTATTTTRTTTRTTSTISTADTTHVPPVPAATEAAEHEQDGSRSHADNDDDDVDAGDVGSPTLDVVMLARKFVAFARPFTVHSGWDALCASSRVALPSFVQQRLRHRLVLLAGIGVLAAIQAQALHAGILIPAAFVTSTSALAWFLWIGGIFIEMALMFLLVMIEPFTVGSFLVLLLFIGTVAVEQFQPTSRWRNWLLTATGLLSATLLPLGYASMMPAVQSWLEGPDSPMPQADYQIMWQAFRLQDGASFEVRMKLAYLGGLLLLSASLRRVFKFGAEASLIGARTQAHLREHLLMMRVFLEVSRWSTAVLMFVSYFLMQRLDAFSRIQLGALLALLVSGRYWEYAGALISITSSVLLLAQYAYTFKFAPLPEEQADYWGLNWGYPTEVCLLLLGIVQRTVKRAATHLTLNSEMAAGFDEAANVNRRRLRQETAAYGAQLGMVLLMLVAWLCLGCFSTFSFVHCCFEIKFILWCCCCCCCCRCCKQL